jgi:hypothetical protein
MRTWGFILWIGAGYALGCLSAWRHYRDELAEVTLHVAASCEVKP